MSEFGSVVSLVEEEGSLVTNERIDDLAGRSCVVTACSGKAEKNVPERRGALLKLLEREGSHQEKEILEMVLNHHHWMNVREDVLLGWSMLLTLMVIRPFDNYHIKYLLHYAAKYLRWCSRWYC